MAMGNIVKRVAKPGREWCKVRPLEEYGYKRNRRDELDSIANVQVAGMA
jgi:hypothetical protein